MQRLFELTQLFVAVHYESHDATVTITLPRGGFGVAAAVVDTLPEVDQTTKLTPIPAIPQVEASVNAAGAPWGDSSCIHTGFRFRPGVG